VVISEKSKLEFAMFDLSGIARSRMSTIRIWNYPFDPCCSAARDGRWLGFALFSDGADGRLAR
jgi:phosphatidylserine synthase